MQCPECGAVVSAEDLFCGECGAVLAEPLFGGAAGGSAVNLPPPPVLPSPPPVHARPVQDTRANVAYILGIASVGTLLLSCVPFLGMGIGGCVSPVVGIVAIILGAAVKRDVEARGGLEADRQKAQRGMVLGIIGTAIYFALLVLGILISVGLSILGEL